MPFFKHEIRLYFWWLISIRINLVFFYVCHPEWFSVDSKSILPSFNLKLLYSWFLLVFNHKLLSTSLIFLFDVTLFFKLWKIICFPQFNTMVNFLIPYPNLPSAFLKVISSLRTFFLTKFIKISRIINCL